MNITPDIKRNDHSDGSALVRVQYNELELRVRRQVVVVADQPMWAVTINAPSFNGDLETAQAFAQLMQAAITQAKQLEVEADTLPLPV